MVFAGGGLCLSAGLAWSVVVCRVSGAESRACRGGAEGGGPWYPGGAPRWSGRLRGGLRGAAESSCGGRLQCLHLSDPPAASAAPSAPAAAASHRGTSLIGVEGRVSSEQDSTESSLRTGD